MVLQNDRILFCEALFHNFCFFWALELEWKNLFYFLAAQNSELVSYTL